ncbi:methyl-accepting chemotaxis protein [Sphingobium sp. SCG-1]|uniref:methyl-accepting chemotaxis protein n=1 Tax=Sphingobium sp. SCG-1 TaxID=2072936 RepID=UPI001670C5C9|nr:methyl-accepting chemotaxis protein [Sphingobium sp. SCG-1]
MAQRTLRMVATAEIPMLHTAEQIGTPISELRKTVPVSYRHSISHTAQLVDALDLFQAYPQMRMLPVVDDHQRPVGAIFEQDMRLILFNPYGHALLKNPSYGAHLHGHIRPCPAVEATASIENLIDTFAQVKGHREGLIVTQDGRYCGVISNAVLLQLAAERDAEAAKHKAARLQRLQDASDEFRADASNLAATLVAIAGELSDAAETMADSASENSNRAADVAAAASQAAANMTEVASRGRSLAESVHLVEQQVAQAQTATRDAAVRAEQNDAQTHLLSGAAREIGDVVSLIDSVAKTTTTLAFNAAIEAARAGEPGKSFAVVAHEVKSLAQQTREATGHISKRVTNIQQATEKVFEGHERIALAVADMNILSESVVSSVVEQSAAIRSITANVDEASRATGHIHLSSDDIHQNAVRAARDAGKIHQHSRALSAQAQSMRLRLERFLDIVRTS